MEDKESGVADPLNINDDDEKYETLGEAYEEEEPSGNETTGKGKGGRLSGGTSPERVECPDRKTAKERRLWEESFSEGKEELLAEGSKEALRGSIPRMRGCLTRKVGTPGDRLGERDRSLERSNSPWGQDEKGLGGPRGPERYQIGGRQLHLIPATSKKGPNSSSRIFQFDMGESKEGEDKGRSNPSRKSAANKPPGKAVKHHSPPANPDIKAGAAVGAGSPSKASRKKATSPRPPRPQKTMTCLLWGRVCHGPKVFNKHSKEWHMGTRFQWEYCPQKFTTSANKKKHEHKVCHSVRSPAETRCRDQNPTPEPEEGEDSKEGRTGARPRNWAERIRGSKPPSTHRPKPRQKGR